MVTAKGAKENRKGRKDIFKYLNSLAKDPVLFAFFAVFLCALCGFFFELNDI